MQPQRTQRKDHISIGYEKIYFLPSVPSMVSYLPIENSGNKPKAPAKKPAGRIHHA